MLVETGDIISLLENKLDENPVNYHSTFTYEQSKTERRTILGIIQMMKDLEYFSEILKMKYQVK